ncbi:hypothetical protein Daus18300_000911 [Diaporthe australafricana]|uniref:Mediator of RNA polymerase II transcription subunit 11 n=1 Tax=Diaporthe australafricana TaxID=127596 RepID=A0ABR3Y0Q2_9PEZI
MDQPNPPVDIHAPFTRAERMQQLADIDHDIASLLDLTGTAIQSLGKQSLPPPSNNSNSNNASAPEEAPSQPQPSAAEQTRLFEDAMNKFLSTLHSVDARLKRQILGLDEAGIISLPKDAAKDKSKDDDAAAAAAKPALEPNGVGMVGDLDVGWLNSRSNQVEREMEAELWTKARTHLETVSGGAAATNHGSDAEMTG